MTVDEFKKLKPEYKDVEGDTLWNAMEDYMIRLQDGDNVLKQVKPFYKRYQLRWLLYKTQSGFPFSKDVACNDRCKNCKKPSSTKFMMLGENKCTTYCMKCGNEYIGEPNTNFNHKVYISKKKCLDLLFYLLKALHIVKIGSRYDMFGDENQYVKSWTMDMNTAQIKYNLKNRKWWEYIIIEKK